jgi:hypothetical protein
MGTVFGKKELDIVESKLSDYLAPRLLAAERKKAGEGADDELGSGGGEGGYGGGAGEGGGSPVDEEKVSAEISSDKVEDAIEGKVDPEDKSDVAEDLAEGIAETVADVAEAIDGSAEEAKGIVVEVLSGEETGEEIVAAAKRIARKRRIAKRNKK